MGHVDFLNLPRRSEYVLPILLVVPVVRQIVGSLASLGELHSQYIGYVYTTYVCSGSFLWLLYLILLDFLLVVIHRCVAVQLVGTSVRSPKTSLNNTVLSLKIMPTYIYSNNALYSHIPVISNPAYTSNKLGRLYGIFCKISLKLACSSLVHSDPKFFLCFIPRLTYAALSNPKLSLSFNIVNACLISWIVLAE